MCHKESVYDIALSSKNNTKLNVLRLRTKRKKTEYMEMFG